MVQGTELIQRFEQFAPKSLALPGDPVGIQIGDANKPLSTVLVTLDVRPEVVAEAKHLGADMIFAHHPAMFRPAKNLNYANPQMAMYAACVRDDILVYGAHTNLDRAQGGMNDWLAAALDLENVAPFIADGEAQGMGRIGQLKKPLPLEAFVAQVKAAYDLAGLRVIANDLTRTVHTVAVLGGDGGQFYPDAKAAGADVYITGDVYYHTGHDMLAADLPVIDPGHHIEAIMKTHVRDLLKQWAEDNDWTINVVASEVNTDPYTFM